MSNKIKAAKNKLIRDTILDTAKKIIEAEGLDSLSIRKLAAQVGYSPANIYQYYKSKSEIIEAVVQQGYQQIINSLRIERLDFDSAEAEIRYKFGKYIESALQNKDYYKAVMLSEKENLLKQTSILKPEFCRNPSAFKLLQELIERGQSQGEFENGNSQTKAKIIWTATFGLIIRLIIEKIDNKEKQLQLIENHFDIIFGGIRKNRQ
ncbi:TetR family transcriptional regulator [Halanaerobium saccharolyticum]|jgi:AcrR family transcriptional regulator|uniref:TetR family transcriptional regulator n=1 Tax=Halanaerobium saccharolyticum TaxID=43595 RepID=A0A4V3CXV6_9FIRM|nr:TetR/AcrR family transcriptional regulator [Halanaerobium saccharolyticum]TDP91758.1 TetR family transcriptional regulator [Halanaerobium saccharolyticum]